MTLSIQLPPGSQADNISLLPIPPHKEDHQELELKNMHFVQVEKNYVSGSELQKFMIFLSELKKFTFFLSELEKFTLFWSDL